MRYVRADWSGHAEWDGEATAEFVKADAAVICGTDCESASMAIFEVDADSDGEAETIVARLAAAWGAGRQLHGPATLTVLAQDPAAV